MLDRPMRDRASQEPTSSYPAFCYVSLVAFLIILSPNTVYAEESDLEESLAGQIDLIYTSDMKLREMQGGTWETIRFDARESPRYPRSSSPPTHWRKYRNNPRIRFIQDRENYKNLIMLEFEHNPAEVSSRLLALRSLEDSGLETERRPLKEVKEGDATSILKQPKDIYRKITIERSKRSSALEDIVVFETRRLTDSEMERKYGIEWGQSIDDVSTSTLVRGFQFKSPKAILQDSGWLLLQWERYSLNQPGRLGAEFLETPLAGSEGVRHYFYVGNKQEKESLRIVAVHPIRGLVRFHDYEAGTYRVTSRAGDQIRYVDSEKEPESKSPTEFRSLALSRSRLGAASASLRLAQIDLRGNYTLYNTEDFLSGPGQMFSNWDELRESRYDFYALNAREEDSSGRYQTEPDPSPFCFVEYAENAVDRVVVYNELLIETDYRTPTWWMQNGSRMKWTLFGVLTVTGTLFLAIKLTVENRRKHEEERQAGERDKSKKREDALEYADESIDYFIDHEDYKEAKEIIDQLRSKYPVAARETRHHLRRVRKAKLATAKRAIDMRYERILSSVEEQGMPALVQLENLLSDHIAEVNEERSSKVEALKDINLRNLDSKQSATSKNREKEIRDEIRAREELKRHLEEKLHDVKKLANNKDKFEMFVNFLAGSLACHEQKAIEILAAARNIEIDRLRNNLPLFISLMNQDNERRLIASNVIGKRLELEERAGLLEQEVSHLNNVKARQAEELEKLKQDLRIGRRDKKELKRISAALQKTEDDLQTRIVEREELRERIRWYEDEERKEAELREQERARLLRGIRDSVYAEDDERDEFKSRKLGFDSEFGFIIAEAHRVLQVQINKGRWVDATDTPEYVMRVVEGFLREADYESRFLHSDGKKIIQSLNGYLAGKEPLSEARELATRLTSLKWALERVREGNSRYLLESWLEPHRKQQTDEHKLFRNLQHLRQAELQRNLLPIKLTEPTLEEWINTWDEQPWLFVEF